LRSQIWIPAKILLDKLFIICLNIEGGSRECETLKGGTFT